MRLGLSWTDAATVVVSTVGIYLAFLVLLRIVGQHAVAAMSSFDFAAAIAFGAVLGRTVLGYTLSGSIIGFGYAACEYSLIRPPRIGRRRTRPVSALMTSAEGFGGRWSNERCGRCPL
jgi:hypothetical protein